MQESIAVLQGGTLQLIAIHNILKYMQIAVIKTEAADFEN